MKKFNLLKSMLLLCMLMVGIGAWADTLKTSDLNWGTPSVSADFNSLSSESQTGKAGSTTTVTNLTGFGPFTHFYAGKNASCKIEIANAASPMTSKFFKLYGQTNITTTSFSGSFATTGAYSFVIDKSSVGYIGLYKDQSAESTSYTKASASVYLNFTGSKIQISKNTSSGNWQDIVTSLPSTDLIEVTVVYNNTASATTYGDNQSLAAKTAHVFVNGERIEANNAAKAFTISGLDLGAFRISANTAANVSIDDLKIYNSLPTTAGPAKAQTLSSISLSGQRTEFHVGDAFAFNGTVTASYEENDVEDANVTSSTTFSGYDMNTAGVQTVTASYTERNVTKTAQYDINVREVLPYTVTYTQPENGTLTVVDGNGETIVSGSQILYGQHVVATATPNYGYKFRNLQIIDATTHTFQTATKDWTMGDNDITIKANFDEIPSYVINWYVNGSIVKTENLLEGEAVNAPEVEDINGKKFQGWVTESNKNYSNDTTAPVYVEPAKANDNANYYAVFATQEGENLTLTYNWEDSEPYSAAFTNTFLNTYSRTGVSAQSGSKYGANVNDSNNGMAGSSCSIKTNNKIAATKVSFYYTKTSTNTTAQNWVLKTSTNNSTWTTNSTTFSASSDEITVGEWQKAEWELDGTAAYIQITMSASGTAIRAIDNLVIEYGTPAVCTDFTTLPAPPTSTTVTFRATDGENYYATFSCDDHVVAVDEAWVNEAGTTMAAIKAYSVSVADGQLTLTDLFTTHNDGNYTYIPKGTGVLLKYTLGEGEFDGNVTLDFADEWDGYLEEVQSNDLYPASKDKAEFSDHIFYMLNYAAENAYSTLGFYWGAPEGGVFVSREGGAYLAVPREEAGLASTAKGFSFADAEAAGITNVETVATSNAAYNLNGQRVNANAKGIVIINGKKVLNK